MLGAVLRFGAGDRIGRAEVLFATSTVTVGDGVEATGLCDGCGVSDVAGVDGTLGLVSGVPVALGCRAGFSDGDGVGVTLGVGSLVGLALGCGVGVSQGVGVGLGAI